MNLPSSSLDNLLKRLLFPHLVLLTVWGRDHSVDAKNLGRWKREDKVSEWTFGMNNKHGLDVSVCLFWFCME